MTRTLSREHTEKNGSLLFCERDCKLIRNFEPQLYGIYACANPESDHYAHIFMSEHPSCINLVPKTPILKEIGG